MRKYTLFFIAVLVVAIPSFILLYSYSKAPTQIELTQEEKAYLQDISPIKIAVDPDWEPFEKLDKDGNYTGVAADYIKMIEERLDTQFTIVPTKDWAQSIEYSKKGKVTMLPFLNKTEEREKWLTFTEPLFVDDNVLIGRYDTPYIKDVSVLKNKTVVLPEGTSVEERVRQDYPNIRIKTAKDESEAFQMVEQGQAHFTIRSMLVSSYYIRKQGWFDLKIVGKIPAYTNYLSIGILKNEEKLVPILNKAILSITEQEHVDILNKHVPLRVEMPNDNQTILRILIITILLASLFLFMSMIQSARAKKLKKHNDEIQAITERYEALSELAGTYFWQVDLNGNYTYVSPEVKQVLGYEVEQLLGKNYKDIHLDALQQKELENLIQSGTVIKNHEITQTKNDGSKLWLKVNMMPMYHGKQIIGFRGNCTDIEKRKQLEEALIRTKEEIELAYYQAQIGPHFLYNALSAIAMYCLTEPKKASKLIIDLSFFLRKSFDFKSIQQLVTFEQEMALIKAYVNIEKVRYNARLQVNYDIEHVPKNILLPPLILQPLVENAINHGIMQRLEGGTITIKATQLENHVKFEVIDDGIGIPDEQLQYLQAIRQEILNNGYMKNSDIPRFERHGVGLKNIHVRLIKRYNSELVITRNAMGGTTVMFELPINLKGDIS